jgi:hypothetical protein
MRMMQMATSGRRRVSTRRPGAEQVKLTDEMSFAVFCLFVFCFVFLHSAFCILHFQAG